jgi:hypothetical protein
VRLRREAGTRRDEPEADPTPDDVTGRRRAAQFRHTLGCHALPELGVWHHDDHSSTSLFFTLNYLMSNDTSENV